MKLASSQLLGAKGCFLSHLGVLKDAQLKQFKQILIFEDELRFK